MARLHPATGDLSVKVVYYGPPSSGKTTNLQQAHQLEDPDTRSGLVGASATGDRTLFFEYYASDLGTVGTRKLRAEFYTVPGQIYSRNTRRLVLQGADGVVFVADSHPSRHPANLEALDDLSSALGTHGVTLDTLPHVFQWNKRDLAAAVDVAHLSSTLNPARVPETAAVAREGIGVLETRDQILTAVFTDLRRRLSRGSHG